MNCSPLNEAGAQKQGTLVPDRIRCLACKYRDATYDVSTSAENSVHELNLSSSILPVAPETSLYASLAHLSSAPHASLPDNCSSNIACNGKAAWIRSQYSIRNKQACLVFLLGYFIVIISSLGKIVSLILQ